RGAPPPLPRHPPDAAVGGAAAELDLEPAPLLDRASDRCVDGAAILRVDELAKGVERSREAARNEAVDALEVLGPAKPSAHDVPVPDAHAAGLERESQPLLAQLELRVVAPAATLREVALRDRRAEEEARDRDHGHEELQHDEASLGALHHERAPALPP